jgi:hypothetical protein
MDLVQAHGKQNKKVYTLLTQDIIACLDTLCSTRTESGIDPENQYLFANSHKGYLSHYDTLYEEARNAGCSRPNLITSTRLRKHIATICQVNM